MEKATATLTLKGSQQIGNVPIQTPVQSITVQGEGRTFTEAVNNAVHKLSNALSLRECGCEFKVSSVDPLCSTHKES